MVRTIAAALAAAVLLATPAPAQEAPPKCPADAAPVPAGLSGWATRTPVQGTADGAGAPRLAVGKGYDLKLLPIARTRYLTKRKRDQLDGFGGAASVAIDRAGTYRVAIGGGAWIDVVRDGKALESIAHGHGPACSGIGKMVSFALVPGNYLVTIDGSDDSRIPILVARVP